MNRSEWADVCKGIGIILVVFGHVQRGLFNAGFPMDEAVYKLVDSIVYSFHMPLFFFISGLFFYDSLSRTKQSRFIVRKIDVIVYPYVLWSVVQGCVEAILSRYTNSHVTFIEVFSLWQPRAQFWFLYTLFLIFVVSSFVYRFVARQYLAGILPVLAALYIFNVDFLILKQISPEFVFFGFGVWFNEIKGCVYRYRGLVATISSAAFFAGQFYFHVVLDMKYTDVGYMTMVLSLVSIVFVCSASMFFESVIPRLIGVLGRLTMPIYVMHILAGSGVRIVLQKIFGVYSTEVHVLFGVFVGIGFPLFINWMFERAGVDWLMRPPRFLSVEHLYNRFSGDLVKSA